MSAEYYVGLLSGTSADAIDAALVEFNPQSLTVVATHSHPLPQTLKAELSALTLDSACTLIQIGELDHKLGHAFAQCANELIAKSAVPKRSIRGIGSHGQNLYHRPNGDLPFTWQIGDPNIIATETNITTVADFRRRDVSLGGQGAPLTPAFHQFAFQTQTSCAIINLGGIANITFLPENTSEPIIGFDSGPANALLDSWCFKHRKEPFDKNGQWAASGKIQPKLLSDMLADPYFQKSAPKSTGREYFNLNWLEPFLRGGDYSAADVQMTLTELTAASIHQCLKNLNPKKFALCGGGVNNNVLRERLAQYCAPTPLQSTTAFGLAPEWVEAAAFAWMAKQTLHGLPSNLPDVTGAKKTAILGGIYEA